MSNETNLSAEVKEPLVSILVLMVTAPCVQESFESLFGSLSRAFGACAVLQSLLDLHSSLLFATTTLWILDSISLRTSLQ
jgi:hypothetical protein